MTRPLCLPNIFYGSIPSLTRALCSVTGLTKYDYTREMVKNFKNPNYFDTLDENIKKRKGNYDIRKLKSLWSSYSNAGELEKKQLEDRLHRELLQLPNKTCPHSKSLLKPFLLSEFGTPRNINDALPFEKLSHHGVDQNSPNFTGSRSYYLRGSMAQLEHNLVRYALKELVRHGFHLVSVPDIVSEDLLQCSGIPVVDGRTMAYHLDPASMGGTDGMRLSGTAEIGLCGLIRGKTFQLSELPLKLCAVSRCHRAEAKGNKEERGIFRVHNFTKVEMFGITANETGTESHELYQEMISLQKELLTSLGLHGQVLLMPPSELGQPAYSKTDLEAWFPGRGLYGELTSASNCTDYQSARLHTTYVNNTGEQRLVHTINGTAVAVPRCIIAMCESLQEEGGRKAIQLPKALKIPSLSSESGNEDDTVFIEGKPELQKIMVYHEQCKRKHLSDFKFSQ